MTVSVWTDTENRALVSLYFAMLDKASRPITYNKAMMIRNIQAGNWDGHTEPLKRSKGSIEFKLMNCSAAHRDIFHGTGQAVETMHKHGYRKMPNYQAALKEAMKAHLDSMYLAPLPTAVTAYNLGREAAQEGYGKDCNPWLKDAAALSQREAWDGGHADKGEF